MPRILNAPFRSALIVENPHRELDDHLRKVGIDAVRLDKVPDEDALIRAINDAEAHVLFKRSRVPVTRTLLERCPSLHMVQLCCIGADSVDMAAAADEGVIVCNDPISNGRSVVELAMGHLIALSRRLYETDVAAHANKWQKNNKGRFEVLGKTLGIVGLGNIGRQVARACQNFGMQICFYDNRLVAQEVGTEMGWRRAESLDELFASSDMVTVHVSAHDADGNDNAGFLDPYLARLAADRGDNAPRIFLNLARGNVHSTDALLEAIACGAIRRAAIDVYPSEPSPGQDDLWKNPYADEPRVVCTPHIGAATQEAQPRIARRVADTVGTFSRTGSLRDCVFEPRLRMQVQELSRGQAVLAVVHSVSRGTKKAIDDAIFEAEGDNLGSQHRDFPVGVAYDLSILDRPLPQEALQSIVERATALTGSPDSIRAIRQVVRQ